MSNVSSDDDSMHSSAAAGTLTATSRDLRRLALAALGTALIVPLMIPFDIAVAQWWRSDPLPGDVARAIELTEVFAHGIGVAYVLIGCFVLVPRTRAYLPRVAALAFGAGAVATFVKVFVIRGRPRTAVQLEALHWESAWNFQFDPLLEKVTVFDATWRSFPSGHTATAVGLAIGLAMLFPRGRNYFVALAAVAVVQRVSSGAHFVSDVIFGLAIGYAWSFVCLHPLLLGALFRPMEPGSERRGASGRAPGSGRTADTLPDDRLWVPHSPASTPTPEPGRRAA